MSPYSPRPGTLTARIIDALRDRDWVSSSALAFDCDMASKSVNCMLRHPLFHGFIERRLVGRDAQWRIVRESAA